MLIPAGCWTSTLVSWRPADLFILGVFVYRFRLHGKLVTKELITCVRSVVPEHAEFWLSHSQSSTLTGPLWRSHRAAIELHSLWLPAPSSDECYGRWGCVHSLGWLGLRRGQTNAVAWQANWETLLCEQCVCGARAPEVWISFKGVFEVSFNSPQSVLKVACINKPGSL